MNLLPYILFCENPLEPAKVEPDFESEWLAAKPNGFTTLLFNFDDLISDDRLGVATKRIKQMDEPATVIYRGWMLTPAQYRILYYDLLNKNYKLINTVEEYQNCHYLPDSLQFIGHRTPVTVFEKVSSGDYFNTLLEKVKIFGNSPVIIKDYVKSEKHDWHTACFVTDASDTEQLKKTIDNFLHLRGQYLNEGIVIRAFEELNGLTIHSKSGMPLTEEYRLFFLNKQLLAIYNYWEEGTYDLAKPDTKEFDELAATIDSNFFSMDIARTKSDGFIIIELGDGQVAGLPDRADKGDFYMRLKEAIDR